MTIKTKYVETSCKCPKCKNMCKTRPCWPTPKETLKIMKAGFGDKLMNDYWDTTNIISPAIIGFEKEGAPFWPTGRCTFLNKKNLCILHDLKLKPFEGKMANCKKTEQNLHEYTYKTWDTKLGRKVVEQWEKENIKNENR